MSYKWPNISPWFIKNLCWPLVQLYDKQIEIVQSIEENYETYVPAGNQLGKDFVTGFLVINLFLRCIKAGLTCRIVTSSATKDHLNVLWSEMADFIAKSRIALLDKDGGPLVFNHLRISYAKEKNIPPQHQKNYIIGVVASSESRGEGLAGHHADVTLGVVDEASGSSDIVYTMFQGWMKRLLVIGNPHDCANFFRRGVEAGDLPIEAKPLPLIIPDLEADEPRIVL